MSLRLALPGRDKIQSCLICNGARFVVPLAPPYFSSVKNDLLDRTVTFDSRWHDGAHLKPDGPDKALIRLVAKARSWWAIIAQGQLDPTALARKAGVTVSYVTRVVRLAFLSPEIVEAIMAGGLKAGIDGSELMRAGTIDPDWERQAEQLLAG